METIDRVKNKHAVYRDGAGILFSAKTETDSRGALTNVVTAKELKPKISSLRYRRAYTRASDIDVVDRYTTSHEMKIVVPLSAPVVVGDLMMQDKNLYRVYYTDADHKNRELYVFLENYRRLK